MKKVALGCTLSSEKVKLRKISLDGVSPPASDPFFVFRSVVTLVDVVTSGPTALSIKKLAF